MAEAAWPSLVPLRQGSGSQSGTGARSASGVCDIVLVHGRAGNIVNLQVLADRLPAGHQVYALQARGLDGRTQPHGTITEMAEAYLSELRPVLSGDEVVLVGYSGGGLIAIEMARRLSAAGSAVRSVVLLDTALPGPDRASRARRLVRRAQDEGRDLPRFVRQRTAAAARRRLRRPAPEDELVDLGPHFDAADAAHRLLPYSGAVTLIRARTWTEPADLGWSPFLTGPVTLHDVRGGHVRMLLPPHVDEVARILAAVSAPRGFTTSG
jgi:thioesterase domain-containing protein